MKHLGWDWNRVEEASWTEVSGEFLSTALEWIKKFSRMLDIGAGKGRHAFFMSQLGMNVTAVDIAQSSIDIIKAESDKKSITVKALIADMVDLPFEDCSFDCVLCFHCIYHTDFAGMKKAIREIERVLIPGGEAFITFNAKGNPSYYRGEKVDENTIYKTEGIEKNIPHTYVDKEELLQLLLPFQVIKLQRIEDIVRKSKQTEGVHFFTHIIKPNNL
jgi:SAM-dependent methyltransferase